MGTRLQDQTDNQLGLSSMSLNRRIGPLSKQAVEENKKLSKSLRERRIQLRIIDYPDPDDSWWDCRLTYDYDEE